MVVYASKKKQTQVESDAAKQQKEAIQKAQEEQFIRFAYEQVSVDKQTLMNKFPFTGNFISRLDVEIGNFDDVPTACTNGEKIWINILFYIKLDPEERLFVLAHECWHVILRHFLRKMNRNQELWNWATDLEIHFLLTKEGLKAPFVLPHDPAWKDLSFEEIYDRLIQQAKNGQALGSGKKLSKKDKQGAGGISISKDELGEGDDLSDFDGDGSSSDGDGEEKEGGGSSVGKIPKEWNQGKDSKNLKGASSGKGWDSHEKKEDPDSKDDDPSEIESRIAGKIKAAADFAKKRSRGTVPSHLQQLLDNLPKNEIPWQQVLRQFVTQQLHGDRTWVPPNRRHVWKNVYVQSKKSEFFRGVVALDTSGSCAGDLPKFFSELTGLLNTFGQYEIDVVQCDCEIQNVEHYSDEVQPPANKKWEAYGYGGTDHRPVFDWVDKNCVEPPNCVICITDLYTEAPKNPPSYPVLWIVTKNGNINGVPWGIKTQFKS